jgi:biotin transport system substrate-specific component
MALTSKTSAEAVRGSSFVVDWLRALSRFDSSLTREIMLVLTFNALLVATAQISFSLPFTIVPVTGQTFGVLLIAMALGRVRAVSVIGLYLLEGAMGLPVFAGATGGVAVLVGPTGGYLLGFLLAALVVGALADRGWDRSYLLSASALLIGTLLIFACGLSQLSFFVGHGALLQIGFYPFLAGAALKVALAFWLIPSLARGQSRFF